VWHDGEFVDQPVHTSGPVPHWSRWEQSATTLGPVGRVLLTVVVTLWALGSITMNPIMAIFVVPVTLVVLSGVWHRGWVVPAAPSASDASRPPPAAKGWAWDRREAIRTAIVGATVLIGVGLLMSVDDAVVRFVVIVTGVIAGAVWMLRAVGGRSG